MPLSLRQQVAGLGLRPDLALNLSKRNGFFSNRLNDELGLFKKIIVLDHPHYLMQYHRRNLTANVAKYVEALGECLSPANPWQLTTNDHQLISDLSA